MIGKHKVGEVLIPQNKKMLKKQFIRLNNTRGRGGNFIKLRAFLNDTTLARKYGRCIPTCLEPPR